MIADESYANGLKARQDGDLKTARLHFYNACAMEPHDDAVWAELGRCLADLGHPEEALPSLERANRINPRNHHTLCLLGAVYAVLGETKRAAKVLDKCLEIAPHMPAGHWNRAGVRLAQGDYRGGFADYEYGFCNQKRTPRFPTPQWDGKAKGKVLFWSEQGAGDIMMFSRFIRYADAEYSIFEVPASLLRLMEASEVADKITVTLGDGATVEDFDYHCSILSLPHILGLNQGEISGVPYLSAPMDKTYVLESDKPKVGWNLKGNPAYANDGKRSIHNPMFVAPLFGRDDVEWLCFQKGHEGAITNDCADWADTADALRSLDMLVTTDTGIAHLAGAVGLRTLLMVPYTPDWRWGGPQNPTKTTHWYDSVEIYRQPRARDWTSVIKEVVAAL